MFPLFGGVLVILLVSDFIRKKYFRGQNPKAYRVLRSETLLQQINHYLKDFFGSGLLKEKSYPYGMTGAKEASEAHKTEGNDYLKEGNYEAAMNCYGKLYKTYRSYHMTITAIYSDEHILNIHT